MSFIVKDILCMPDDGTMGRGGLPGIPNPQTDEPLDPSATAPTVGLSPEGRARRQQHRLPPASFTPGQPDDRGVRFSLPDGKIRIPGQETETLTSGAPAFSQTPSGGLDQQQPSPAELPGMPPQDDSSSVPSGFQDQAGAASPGEPESTAPQTGQEEQPQPSPIPPPNTGTNEERPMPPPEHIINPPFPREYENEGPLGFLHNIGRGIMNFIASIGNKIAGLFGIKDPFTDNAPTNHDKERFNTQKLESERDLGTARSASLPPAMVGAQGALPQPVTPNSSSPQPTLGESGGMSGPGISASPQESGADTFTAGRPRH